MGSWHLFWHFVKVSKDFVKVTGHGQIQTICGTVKTVFDFFSKFANIWGKSQTPEFKLIFLSLRLPYFEFTIQRSQCKQQFPINPSHNSNFKLWISCGVLFGVKCLLWIQRTKFGLFLQIKKKTIIECRRHKEREGGNTERGGEGYRGVKGRRRVEVMEEKRQGGEKEEEQRGGRLAVCSLAGEISNGQDNGLSPLRTLTGTEAVCYKVEFKVCVDERVVNEPSAKHR